MNVAMTAFLMTVLWWCSPAQQQAEAGLAYALPQTEPDNRYKADILLIVAHPDDETAVGSYLAKAVIDDGKRIAVIYANRGEGGGNSIGDEQASSLGAIREIEARRAVGSIGIHNVWFLNGRDTPGQDVFRSLQTWGHGSTLEQVVRLIRLARPEVILTWLPHFVAGENHGDHQAAGIIATEAFDLAGDPTAYPSQVVPPREPTDISNVTEGLRVWQPKKIYYFSDASHPFEASGPPFDIGEISRQRRVPFYRIAAELQTYHRTQADVSEPAAQALRTGNFDSLRLWLQRFRLVFGKSVVPCRPTGDVFEGVTQGAAAFKRTRGYPIGTQRGVAMELGGVFAFYRNFWHAHEIEHLASIVEPEIEIAVHSYLHIPLLLRNDTEDSVEVLLESGVPAGWKEASGSGRYRLGPFETRSVQTFFIAPPDPAGQMEDIRWMARVGGNLLNTVVMKVKVSEWTLPQ